MQKSSSASVAHSKNKAEKKCQRRLTRASASSVHSSVPALAVRRTSRNDRRKRATVVVKPSFTLPGRPQRRRAHCEKESRIFDEVKCTSRRAEATGSKTGSLEERREVHRVHERQRHRSLNEAMKELVKILPPSNPSRSVTKYNVLRTANDYIDFLQHKITHLCLERSIEQNSQDGRISFNIPLNAVIGGEQLKIPAATPVSPKMLQSVHKAAKDVYTGQLASRGQTARGCTDSDCRTPPRRFSRSRLTKKFPQTTAKTSSTASLSASSGVPQGVPQIAFDKPSIAPATLTACTIQTDSELVADDTPSEPARPSGPTPTDPGHGESVADEVLPLNGSDPLGVLSSQPTELPATTPAVSNRSNSCKHLEIGSTLSSASTDRKERGRLLDTHLDASRYGEYALPPTTPRHVEECSPRISLSSPIPVVAAPIQPSSLPYQFHTEHSYSAKFLPAYTASSIPDDDGVPVAVVVPSSLESSRILPSAASEPEIVTASQGRVSSSSDVIPCILSSSLYVQQPVSFPIGIVSGESALGPTSLAQRPKPTRPLPTGVTPSAGKSTTRYIPIQPAPGLSSNDAVPKPVLNPYPQSFIMKQATVTDHSAQKLVVDPHLLRFEDRDGPPEMASDCDPRQQHTVMTPAASSGCSLRRSWINGYQLFTKVNHPRFRDEWPRLQGREITRLLSQTWKELPTDFKKQYSCRARQWNQWHSSKRKSASHNT